MGRSHFKSIASVLGIALIHYAVSFFCWSMAPGNAAPGHESGLAGIAWRILSFPMFWLFSMPVRNVAYLFVSNSMIWGILIFFGSRSTMHVIRSRGEARDGLAAQK
jgi:hypothetical protein